MNLSMRQLNYSQLTKPSFERIIPQEKSHRKEHHYHLNIATKVTMSGRSEERRVGKECLL